MIRSGKYNEIDKKFIPVLKPGEVAIYVSSGNSVIEGVAKYPTIYLPNKDTIKHPDDNMPGVVDIAYITQGAPEGRDPIFGQIVFEATEKGVVVLKSDNTLDARKYAYMELSDFNGSKEGRDDTKPIYFTRTAPGKRSEDAFTKAKKDAEALIFAQDTPIGALKELLSERGVKFGERVESDVRFLAMEEYKKKPFVTLPEAVAKTVVPVANEVGQITPDDISEMFEAEILKWSVADKCIVNTDTGTKYEIPGIVQTDKLEVKQRKMLDFLSANKGYGEIMIQEIKSSLK